MRAYAGQAAINDIMNELIKLAVMNPLKNFLFGGKATFTTGANAGAVNEVLLHDGQTIRLFVPMPRPIVVGDQIVLVAGCDKTPETCNAKFANILNIRGEPHIPGNDKVFSYPVRA